MTFICQSFSSKDSILPAFAGEFLPWWVHCKTWLKVLRRPLGGGPVPTVFHVGDLVNNWATVLF